VRSGYQSKFGLFIEFRDLLGAADITDTAAKPLTGSVWSEGFGR
jgi:hypothetical protein